MNRRSQRCALFLLIAAWGCPAAVPPVDGGAIGDVSLDQSALDGGSDGQNVLWPIEVHVTLDGEPSPNTSVSQGGNLERWVTGPEGVVEVQLDLTVPGEMVLIASHPNARIRGLPVYPDHTGPFQIALTSFETTDNLAYVFKDPGEPGKSHVIEKCGHCHLTMDETWFESAHKTSASNPIVQDVYQGTAAAFSEEAACGLAGGAWEEVIQPGTGQKTMGCVTSASVSDTGGFGACADCHAPGIDGALGGRDLLEAKGHAYNYGVHCEVCHHTESVDLSAPPGVAGRLKILRPGEPSPITGLGEFKPLTFCPNDDVPNIYMGCVQRDHFRASEFCAGCHEQAQPALFPGESVDKTRWPEEKIPVHTTYSEWKESVFGAGTTCQACHMPAAPDEIVNGADLQAFQEASTGITGGWPRPPGATRLHTWAGPRTPADNQLAVPVTLTLETSEDAGDLVVSVTTQNVGAGHALPTGEPLRSLLLLVDATCGETALAATGGSAVPDYGGYLAMKINAEDWSVWPQAKAGMVIRVIKSEGYLDYVGLGPFGDGTFSVKEKGLVDESVVGESTITAVTAGEVVLDGSLPVGDVAYLVDTSTQAYAGQAGFGFARVLADKNGQRMVPHFMAVDVVSDNRLLSQASWTSTHRFKKTCAGPSVTAQLIQRAYPLGLARERGWPMRDKVWLSVSE